jgi:hypothetical protein
MRASLAPAALAVLLSACSSHAFPIADPAHAAGAPGAVHVCVVDDLGLRNVVAQVDPVSGDTTVAGVRFATAFPNTAPPYAASSVWYINNEPITLQNRRYVKYGLPRQISVGSLEPFSEFQGTRVFFERRAAMHQVVYVPVSRGCIFQPYQLEVRASVAANAGASSISRTPAQSKNPSPGGASKRKGIPSVSR